VPRVGGASRVDVRPFVAQEVGMQVSALGTGPRIVRAVAIAAAVALLTFAATIPAVGAGHVAASGDVYADFSTQPLGANVGGPAATGDAGVPWAIQPVVSLYGDWDPALVYQVDLRIDPSSPDVGGPGQLTCAGGTSMTMIGGVAAFRGCRIDTAGRAYRLAAYVTPYDPSQGPAQGLPATSLPFDIRGGTRVATGISFTTQPLGANYGGQRPSAPAGRSWAIQPVVSMLDGQGSVITSDDSTVILLDVAPGSPQVGGPGSLTCAGGLSVRVFRGVARFSGCSVDTPGASYQLRAQTVSTGSTLVLTDLSLPFDIGGGPTPARARFTTEPLGATLEGAVPSSPSGTPWAVQPVVSILDASGRLVRGDDETIVTLSVDGSSVPTGGALYCAGGTSLQVLAGVAAFTGCQIVGAGAGYVLRASARSAGGAIVHDLSLPFTITAQTSSLELFPSPFTVAPNGPLTLAATLQGSGTAGKTITFQRQGPDEDGWTDIGTSPTNDAGTATLSTTVAYTSRFRAVFGGAGSLAAATSSPDTVAVQARVAIAPTTSPVKKGTRIVYAAIVRPIPAAGEMVRFRIERYVAGAWTPFAQRSAPIGAAGIAALPWTWGTVGRWRIAAIVPTTIYSAQGRSRTIVVAVR
jgi:hypothetical protein